MFTLPKLSAVLCSQNITLLLNKTWDDFSVYRQDHLPCYGNDQSLLTILEGTYRNRNKTWLSSLSSIKVGNGKLKHKKMNLLGLMFSNIINSGKHMFPCRVESFEYTASFIIFPCGKTNTALCKEVQASSSPKNTRNRLNILFSLHENLGWEQTCGIWGWRKADTE